MKPHHSWAVTALFVTVLFCASFAASTANIYTITDHATLGNIFRWTYSYGFGVNNNGQVG